MHLLYQGKNPSTLIPHAGEPFWTDIDRVFSDLVPTPSGVGAVQTAVQALGLSPADAAALVTNAGASVTSSTQLTSAAALAAKPVINATGINGTRVPIPSTVLTNTAIINGDPNRKFLLLQNNNATGGANLLWSVDAPIDTTQPWAYVNLAPGQGLLFDQELMVNPLYVAWGSGTVTGGVILFGSRAPTPVGTQAVAPGPIALPFGWSLNAAGTPAPVGLAPPPRIPL